MDYEVGSIADLVSGQRTPNRRPVVCRVTTPRKQPPQTPLTPTDSPLVRVRAPKIAFTPEFRGKRQYNGHNGNEFDSPKSEPRRRRSNLANNFRSYSQNERVNQENKSNNFEFKRDVSKKNKKSKNNREDSNNDDKDSGITDSGSNDMNDEIPNENVMQKKKKNKRKIEDTDAVDEPAVVTKKKRKDSQMQVDTAEEAAVVSINKRKDSLKKDVSEKKSKKNKHRKVSESDNYEAVDNNDDENLKKKKKDKKKNDIQSDDALEKTIEKKKKKLQSKTVPKDEEQLQDKENAVEEAINDDEGLTDFQKAARRRVSLKLKRDLKFEPDELSKTIFIGNVPLSVVKSKFKKTFKNIFSKYGVIETIRVRNIPVDDIKTNPKVALIEKKFHSDRTTATVYIKFQDMFSVEKSLAENNTILEGNHIRVDSCDRSKTQGDSRKTLFLGNLPFSIEEEILRQIFEKCGVIKSIRIVRDRKTQIGKGFGFINFEKADGVELALMMSEEDLKINGKAIRVHRYNLSHNSAPPPSNVRNFQGNNTSKPANRKYDSSKYKMNPMNKKRDEFGNKIRKNNEVREKRRFLNESRSNDAGVDESKSKNNNSGNYAGLVAKKKKKTKPDKGIMKKKRISKILTHKKTE